MNTREATNTHDLKPTELWRVCINPKSTDWNDEPEYVVKHYRIFAHDADAKKYWVEMDGWHGFNRRHWVSEKSCYFSLAEVQRVFEQKSKSDN